MTNNEKMLELVQKCLDDWPYAATRVVDIMKRLEQVKVLLKEQETSNTGKARIFQCEKCGYGFDDIFLTDEHNYSIEPNYCPNCGRLVK